MTVRIDCPHQKDSYVEFRDGPWPFGDRRAVVTSYNDEKVLNTIFPYITGWSLKDTSGRPIPFQPTKDIEDDKGKVVETVPNIDALNNIDDLIMLPWFVGAWYEARNQLMKKALEKNT